METAGHHVGVTKAPSVLQRELYTLNQASRLLDLSPTTLLWWLEGGERRGRPYQPVIRPVSTGSKMLTWGEFVEAGYLRQYRRIHNVPLPHVRQFIDVLRDKLEVPYPLAHFVPYIGAGRKLVLEAQQIAELPVDLWLVVPATGEEIMATAPTEQFLSRVDFSEAATDIGRVVERIFPDGKTSPVVFDPDYSFGEPTVEGIRTEALAELVLAGEPVEDVAAEYGLSIPLVKAAVSYEFAPREAA